MSPPKPTPPPLFDGPMYPLASAEIRIRVLAVACWTALDRALRKLHDMPNTTEYLKGKINADDPADVDRIVALFRGEAAFRYHQRMKIDESTCRWCGLAAAEARTELEGEDEQ